MRVGASIHLGSGGGVGKVVATVTRRLDPARRRSVNGKRWRFPSRLFCLDGGQGGDMEDSHSGRGGGAKVGGTQGSISGGG